MIDIPPEAKGGAWVGLTWLGIALLRAVGMKASKDAITLKTDASERNGIDMLQDRVNRLDSRVNELESMRNELFVFALRCMTYVSQCQCGGEMEPSRAELMAEYQRLIRALADKPKEANHESD